MPTETISDTVTVRLDEIIDTDREGFLDLLDTLVNAAGTDGPGPLSDISWEVLGIGDEPNTLVISVIAQCEIEDDLVAAGFASEIHTGDTYVAICDLCGWTSPKCNDSDPAHAFGVEHSASEHTGRVVGAVRRLHDNPTT